METMPKDENIDASSNGASSNGATPDGVWLHGFVNEADRLEVEAQHAAFKELGEELEAEGVNGTAELEKLLAKAATWSTGPA